MWGTRTRTFARSCEFRGEEHGPEDVVGGGYDGGGGGVGGHAAVEGAE